MIVGKISKKRALQYELMYLYVPHSEAISITMELTDVEQRALSLHLGPSMTRIMRNASNFSNGGDGNDQAISEYTSSLRSLAEAEQSKREADWLETATKAAREFLLEIRESDEATLAEYIASRRADMEAKAEAGRFHNQAQHRLESFDFWAKASSWSAEDSVLLSMCLEPSKELQEYLRTMVEADIKQSASPLYLANTQALLQDAIDADIVPKKANILEIVNWFARMEIDFPADLATKVQHYQGAITPVRSSKQNQSQATNAEKKSLLQLVAAMASEQYGFDPTKNNAQTVTNIFDDLEQVGLGMDRKTVRKWLEEAASHIHPDKWEDG